MIDIGQRVSVVTAEDSEVSRIHQGVCDAVSDIGIRVKVEAIWVNGSEMTPSPGTTYVFPWSAVLLIRLGD